MTISSGAFEILVLAALAVTVVAPILLLGLLIRDWKRGHLW
ncbi:MAG: hypothetical protein U5S82_06740 [Gammaproteobacteria bacterium]|nr:hypothetical protein [Gammaproteobacteria bacterium]